MKFHLDFSLETEKERLAYIEQILNNTEEIPDHAACELMASYILYGKDENGQRNKTTWSDTKYKTYQKKVDREESLDNLMENPFTQEQIFSTPYRHSVYKLPKRTINRPKYNEDGVMIDAGDSDIPGMQQLWDSIDAIEHTLAVNTKEGIQPTETDEIITSSYRLYKLRHQLISLRKQQYLLKDSYKPIVKFANYSHPAPPPVTIDFTSDSSYWMTKEQWEKKVANTYYPCSKNIQDYETRIASDGSTEVRWIVKRQKFNWEDPHHIRCLIEHYQDLEMQYGERKADTILGDFERNIAFCDLSETQLLILDCRKHRKTIEQTRAILKDKLGITYGATRLHTIIAKQIPTAIAQALEKKRIFETSKDRKRCSRCGRVLPRHRYFFNHNASRRDGFSSACRDCERESRIRRGVINVIDQRRKDKDLLEMQTKQNPA